MLQYEKFQTEIINYIMIKFNCSGGKLLKRNTLISIFSVIILTVYLAKYLWCNYDRLIEGIKDAFGMLF